ncbi:menaquinone biosynthesis protein [Deltaproteobacteria bacterium TL4]
MNTPLKLGIVDYLNALPVYYDLLSGRAHLPCELVRGTPAALNLKIAAGELDVSNVSSFEYAQHFEHYYLLPHLSISADGPIRSIYLFCQTPLAQLEGTLYLTAHSQTSIHLLQYLLKDHPVTYLKGCRPETMGTLQGELLIGDEAIKSFYKPRFPQVYDLSFLWKEQTQLPFVFAVWVVRREVFDQRPEEVRHLCRTLIHSRESATSQYHKIAENYALGVFPTIEEGVRYMKNLCYDLTPPLMEGFLHFQKCCQELGFLEKVAPLHFIAL